MDVQPMRERRITRPGAPVRARRRSYRSEVPSQSCPLGEYLAGSPPSPSDLTDRARGKRLRASADIGTTLREMRGDGV
jgi:hypothetical protein